MMGLAEQWFLLPLKHIRPRPGEFVQGLPEGTREVLRHLRSADIADVRWPPFDGPYNGMEL